MRWHKRRAGDRPVPGADQAIANTKAPGAAAILPEAVPPPSRPAAAPGHHTGGLDFTVKVWKCGCILLFDGRGVITGTTPCTPADDLDEELRGLLP